MGGISTAPATPSITIDVIKDLESRSDLQKLISPDGNARFNLGSELAKFAGEPVSKAAGQFAASPTLTASPQWTAGPVKFSLTPTAKCTVKIAAKGEDLETAMEISDTAKTQNVQLTPADETTYINIDLDFGLAGNVSGKGTAYGLTISGKAAGSATTTLSFCQPVPSNTETVAALKQAFSAIVFPTSPDGALSRMATGSSCRMTFQGSLSWELDLSYGIAPYKLSAPSAGLLRQAFEKAAQNLTPPSASIKAGVTAAVKYLHTDTFGLIVKKQDDQTAQLYLTRASADEKSASIGVTVGVSATPASVKVDTKVLQQAVHDVTKNAAVATKVANTVAPKINDLESAARSKLMKDWNEDAGISVALDKQTKRTVLFHYGVDLTNADLAKETWNDLLTSKIADATKINGFTLLPGSGVEEQLKQSTTLQLHFFNLFKLSDVTDFFDNCTAELEANGTIRIISDIGVENLVTKNSSGGTVRIHFSGTTTEDLKGALNTAEIDLNIEISEKGDAKAATMLDGLVDFLNQPALDSAVDAMNAYAKGKPSGTLEVVGVLHPSAYGRLKFSPFTGGIGGKPDTDQSLDRLNWNVIHAAVETLMGRDAPSVGPWTYDQWGLFNSYCNTSRPDSLPDRRRVGPFTAIPSEFWKGNTPQLVWGFLNATARGMNLFEDLVTLAKDVASATTAAQWKIIQEDVALIAKSDIDVDYSRPTAAALLRQAAAGGAQVTVTTAQAHDGSSFTTTLTIA
jgi:hypothetical protein